MYLNMLGNVEKEFKGENCSVFSLSNKLNCIAASACSLCYRCFVSIKLAIVDNLHVAFIPRLIHNRLDTCHLHEVSAYSGVGVLVTFYDKALVWHSCL